MLSVENVRMLGHLLDRNSNGLLFLFRLISSAWILLRRMLVSLGSRKTEEG